MALTGRRGMPGSDRGGERGPEERWAGRHGGPPVASSLGAPGVAIAAAGGGGKRLAPAERSCPTALPAAAGPLARLWRLQGGRRKRPLLRPRLAPSLTLSRGCCGMADARSSRTLCWFHPTDEDLMNDFGIIRILTCGSRS